MIKVIKTAQQRKDELEADITKKEEPYKLTAQYVECLTALLPTLINYMVSLHINKNKNKTTYLVAKHLIRNIY